jgi:hypothetical protein
LPNAERFKYRWINAGSISYVNVLCPEMYVFKAVGGDT